MNKLLKTTLVSTALFALVSSTSAFAGTLEDAVKLDVKTACASTKSPAELLATAKKYNPTAVKMEIEFMRFKVTNSKAIAATEKALKEGKKEVALLKKKKYTLTSVKDAAWRTCVFAIRPLQMAAAAEENYHLAVPGDKYTY